MKVTREDKIFPWKATTVPEYIPLGFYIEKGMDQNCSLRSNLPYLLLNSPTNAL